MIINRFNYYLNRGVKIIKQEGIVSLLKRGVKKALHQGMRDQNLMYKKWIDKYEKEYLSKEQSLSSNTIENFSYKPLISILIPVYNIDPGILQEAIESIQKQWYQNYEICLYDDGSKNSDTVNYLKQLKDSDSKIKVKFGQVNQNISVATNNAFELSSGEYMMLMDNDDVMRINCLYEVVKEINKNAGLDLIYFDEDKLDKFGERIEPFFKSDFSYELLYSMMYPTHAIYSRKVFEKVGKMRKGFEGSQDYDLCLRVVEDTNEIAHIPHVLYSWRKVEGSTADNISGKSYALDSAKKALSEALHRRGLDGQIINHAYPFHVVLEPKTKATVNIIIPIKDKIDLLSNLMQSIKDETIYNSSLITITIVNNQSQEQQTKEYLEQLEKDTQFKIIVLEYDKEYNFSAINNFAAKQSDSDYLLFLNNDTKIITKGWLTNMIAWAEQENIGAVGCKLLYPNRYVQHAGVLVGVGGVANHAYYKVPEENSFYFNNLHCIRNYLAVTGACMLISKQKFFEAGGFDENLPRAFNDVDLCLKFYEKGYRNVYLPFVEIIHYESMSRAPQVSALEDNYMNKRWGKYIKSDPFYNPNLNRNLETGVAFEVQE